MLNCLSTNAGSNAQLSTNAADGNACLSTNASSRAQLSTDAADGNVRLSTNAADSNAQLPTDAADVSACLSTNAGSNAQPSTSAAEGELPESKAPAFLLVHGFGAFGEQWRGQIKALTAAGYQVCVHVILVLILVMISCLAWEVGKADVVEQSTGQGPH